MGKTNPNGANNTTSDPREQIMWDFYIIELAKGIDNAYAAAIKAGYSEDHSRNITMQGWFKERLSRLKRRDMFSKAEKKLDKTLDYNVEDKEGNVKVDLLRVQVDVAKHITEKLGKQDGYEDKQTILLMPQELIDKYDLNDTNPSPK